MRVLVVSDLHGNIAALDAVLADVREPCDVTLCLGDLVDYGPSPVECIEWTKQHADYCVRGNHDHGAAHDVEIIGVSGFRYLTMSTRKLTGALIAPDHRRYLAGLPTTKFLKLGDHRIMLVHASPRDPMDEYVPNDVESWAARIVNLNIDFLFVGHTHIPFQLQVGRTTVVNPGSIGLPRDGNPKARYAILDHGKVTLHEVAYDIERTVAILKAAPIDPLAKKMLEDVYRQGRYIHPPGLPVPPKVVGFHVNGKPAKPA
jgi:putative phosphoesterase